ncbi:hypothetical protein N3K66_005375 [Trichothecium roseum]|uniref:Uncharacterized protein n=1 Tax=Trichothecium roseum TaxID=47278 RepID=A0ACC0UXP3_9HYPO|nr:hypothetical protein N3K66_005375 [Trichothecium roseum]
MPPKKRVSAAAEEPAPKRRSTRQAAAAAAPAAKPEEASPQPPAKPKTSTKKGSAPMKTAGAEAEAEAEATPSPKEPPSKKKAASAPKPKPQPKTSPSSRDVTPDPDPDDIPAHNPECVQHEGKWYWLMKAEPESRFENGIDVRFSIDDLRARSKPEGWDGIRAYVARNNMRAMNAGDMAFFYHSNTKTPGIVGTMEIVREFSEDKSARRAGTPYYDPQSTREKKRWDLVHVEFRRKFAVPILLPELKELGDKGGPLAEMQMLRQGRASVSRVSAAEWEHLVRLADQKAQEAGLEHDDSKLN